MSDEKRMIDKFKIIHLLQIGAQEVVVGVNPERKAMCCFCTHDGMCEYYTEAMDSDDYNVCLYIPQNTNIFSMFVFT